MEDTSGRRIVRARHIASKHDSLGLRLWVGYGYGGQQGSAVWVEGLCIDILGRCHFHQFSQIHDRNTIGDMTDDGQVVGDEQICKSTVVAQIGEQIEHLGLYRYIQSRNRLIKDDEFRLHR